MARSAARSRRWRDYAARSRRWRDYAARSRRWRDNAAILVGGVLAAMVIIPAGSASAHAYLASSDPADGSVFSSAPGRLSMGFSESIVLGATSLELVDARGGHFDPVRLQIESGGPGAGNEQPVTLIARLPPLPRNAYRLSWRTLSRDDLHATSGVIVFGVGTAVVAAGSSEPAPRISEASLRWALFCAIAASLGGLLAQRLYRRAGCAPECAARASRWVAVGAGGGALMAAALLSSQVSAAGVSVLDVLTGRYGTGWIVRELGFVTVALAARSHQDLGRRRLATAAAVAIAVGSALTGHNGAAGITSIAADAVHLGAAATWIGGITVLLLCAGRPYRSSASRMGLRAAFLAFGRPAAVCAGALILTGIYLLSGAVGSVDAALQTSYGRILLLKLATFSLVLLLGLLNHRRLRGPHRSVRPHTTATPTPLRTIAVESVAGLVVLAFAALLTSSQPALEPQFIRTAAGSGTPTLNGPAADLQQVLAVRPNQPGRNLVLLQIFNTRRPAPGRIADVTLRLRDADGAAGLPIVAQRLADDRWSASVNLANAGPSGVAVSVTRDGLPAVTSSFNWTVASAGAERRVVVSNAPLRAPLRDSAGALLLVATLLAGTAWFRQRRSAPRPSVARPTAANSTDVAEVGARSGA